MTDAVGAAQQPCEPPKPRRYCGAEVRGCSHSRALAARLSRPRHVDLVASADAYGVKSRGGGLVAVPLDGRRAPGGLVLRLAAAPSSCHPSRSRPEPRAPPR